MHSDSARFSQTIIHAALCVDLNEKLPDPSNKQEVTQVETLEKSLKTAEPTANYVHKNIVLLIAAMSSFITPFTSSSVNIALPSIDRELLLNALELSWIATAYLLAAAIFLVPFGRRGTFDVGVSP
jgi:hypothetical protein